MTRLLCDFFKYRSRKRYDIHHLEWEIKELNRTDPKVNYQIGDLLLTEQPDICHYSDDVNVLA